MPQATRQVALFLRRIMARSGFQSTRVRPNADNIRRVMHLAFYRSVLNAAPSVWLRGDDVSRADTVDTVLVIGTLNFGKTTLVHHALSMTDCTQLVGQGESIAVSVRGGECHIVGLPVGHAVKVGTARDPFTEHNARALNGPHDSTSLPRQQRGTTLGDPKENRSWRRHVLRQRENPSVGSFGSHGDPRVVWP